jgi:hypothetical protein
MYSDLCVDDKGSEHLPPTSQITPLSQNLGDGLKKCLQRPPKRALNLGALSKIVLQARNSRSSETTFVDRKDEWAECVR